MLFFLVLLWMIPLIGMESETSKLLMIEVPVKSLYQIALQKVCSYIFDNKIAPANQKELPSDLIEKITKVMLLTPTITKRYELSSLTPDHRYMLGDASGSYFRWNINTKQEMLIDLLNKEQKPTWVTLSPSGNLVACLSARKLWIKDIVNNAIKAERELNAPSLKQIIFIGEKRLLIEDNNHYLYHFSVKDDGQIEEGMLSTFKYLGVLHTIEGYLILNEKCIMKSHKSAFGRGYDGVTSIQETIAKVKPAIYEPDMLMAYEVATFKGFIKIISLKGNQLDSLGKLITRPTITALSFANKGAWLMIASDNDQQNSGQISIYDWKSADKLYTYESKNRINTISYTDEPSEHPCIFETHDPIASTCLYSFNPIQMVAFSLLKKAKSTNATTNNNNEKKVDSNKN